MYEEDSSFQVWQIENSHFNKEFIRYFHQLISLIFSTNFSQLEQLKKRPNFLKIGPKQVFYSVYQLKNNNYYYLISFLQP